MHYSFAVNRQPSGVPSKWISTLLGMGASILSSFAAYAAVTVGATPGSHQVSPSGAFTYSIPIAVPPGVAGIEPKLSLAYNSQGGNGLLGMGWSLSGLSVIHRCPRTVAQDGVLGGVNYDANDRYCLDGQRLVAVNGSYGANATEYRTESESHSRIVSYGSQGSGPGWWKVWTKSGQIIEYGNTADSKIEAQGKTEVMLWALNKLTDTVSNYLTVTYTEDNPNGQYYPDRIDYTGNTNAGKAPQNSVRFVYETRSDIVPAYHAGSLSKVTVRLTNVQSYAGGTMSRDYRLAYELSPTTQRTRLVNLTECEGGGGCLPATIVEWQQTAVSYQGVATGILAARDSAMLFPADANGDGKTDIIYQPKSTGGICPGSQPAVFFSEGESFGAAQCLGFDAAFSNSVLKIGDFNGDGKADILYQSLTSSGLCGAQLAIFTSTGIGVEPKQCLGFDVLQDPVYIYQAELLIGDVNGDGRSDLVIQSGQPDICNGGMSPALFLANGTGFDPVRCTGGSANPYSSARPYGGKLSLADLNGDGKADLIWQQRMNRLWVAPSCLGSEMGVFYSTGESFNQIECLGFVSYPPDTFALFTTYYSIALVNDSNGDGVADIIVQPYSAGPVNLCQGAQPALLVSDGKKVAKQCLGFDAGYSSTSLSVADMNGDGKSDLIYQGNTNGGLCGAGQAGIVTSNGNGFNSVQCLGFDANKDNVTLFASDVNGDGKPDLIYQPPATSGNFGAGVVGVYLGQAGAHQDLLISVATGSGASVIPTYKPLTDGSVYAKDTTAVYPYVDIQAPIYVAASVSISDGTGGNAVTNYGYAGAKSHQLGGGFLGFRQVTAHDPQARIRSTTTYRQDYPYHGQPLTSQKVTDSGVLLSESLITYTDQLLNPGLSPTWHQSLPTHTVESSHELTGALISTVITDTQYDPYGNPTSIVVNSGGGYSKTTTNLYDNVVDPDRWFLGRLRRSTVNSVTP
ncbi:MAG: VCBS repeat-containing protein [Gammaproteobacteria bacterium]|nr:VCBS repeat-containing protein [Gammaproteobacteria bacterium]MBU1407192.1 VCBS repeat-containing protein [Gammaproteobacteria bacterium]MBU1533288.1 VCBS repeat-containing protein [Gammaproteobacteria bacterium]